MYGKFKSLLFEIVDGVLIVSTLIGMYVFGLGLVVFYRIKDKICRRKYL